MPGLVLDDGARGRKLCVGGGVGGVGTNVPDGGQIFFGPGDRSGESSPRLVRVERCVNVWIITSVTPPVIAPVAEQRFHGRPYAQGKGAREPRSSALVPFPPNKSAASRALKFA